MVGFGEDAGLADRGQFGAYDQFQVADPLGDERLAQQDPFGVAADEAAQTGLASQAGQARGDVARSTRGADLADETDHGNGGFG